MASRSSYITQKMKSYIASFAVLMGLSLAILPAMVSAGQCAEEGVVNAPERCPCSTSDFGDECANSAAAADTMCKYSCVCCDESNVTPACDNEKCLWATKAVCEDPSGQGGEYEMAIMEEELLCPVPKGNIKVTGKDGKVYEIVGGPRKVTLAEGSG